VVQQDTGIALFIRDQLIHAPGSHVGVVTYCFLPQMGRKMEPLSELMLEYYLGFLMECRDFVLTVASKDGSLPEMVSKGREFLLFDDVEHICKRVCRSTMAAARQVSFFGNTLTRIRVYKVWPLCVCRRVSCALSCLCYTDRFSVLVCFFEVALLCEIRPFCLRTGRTRSIKANGRCGCGTCVAWSSHGIRETI
jgi:hypothetical protein